MRFQTLLLSYLNKVANKYSESTNSDNRAKVNFVVTIKPGGSYATMKGGKIKSKNSIDASKGDDLIQIINIININKNEIDTVESWASDKLLDKYKMGEESGIFSDVSYGTLSTFFNIILHELTHAANYHVYSQAFGKLIEFYVRNSKTALSPVYETYPDGLPRSLISDRFLKSKEVFYLYPFNNFVRAWAEIEAGSAGFTANVFASAFILRFIYYLMSGYKKIKNDSHKILVNQKQYSSNPYAFIYKMIVDAIISKTKDVSFFLNRKHDLYRTLFNYLTSSEAMKDYGSSNNLVSLTHVQNIISSVFKPRYGFFRAAKILFATDEGASYYKDFVYTFAAGVANDIMYYFVKYLNSSKFLSKLQSFIDQKISEYESYVGDGKDPSAFFESNVRIDIINMVTELIYTCAVNVVKDLAGDLEIGANYSGLWLKHITSYPDVAMLSNFIDGIYKVLLNAGDRSYKNTYPEHDSVMRMLKDTIYLNEEKTESYYAVRRLMSAIYSAIGANEYYFDSVIEGGGTLKALSSLNIDNATIVSINTYTEVYPIAGSSMVNSKIIGELANASIDVSKSLSKMAVGISDLFHIRSYASQFALDLPRDNMRYTGSVFALIMFLCYHAVNWAYKIIGDLEYGRYRELLKGKFDVNAYLSMVERFINNTDKVTFDIQKMYVDSVSDVISSIDNRGLRNVSGFGNAVNHLYPANFSDLVVLYKSIGAQFRLLELTYKFFVDLFSDKYGNITSLIGRKMDILKEIERMQRENEQPDRRRSRRRSKSVDINDLQESGDSFDSISEALEKVREVQKKIDDLVKNAVDSFIYQMVDLEQFLKDIMTGKGQVDDEDEEDDEKENENENDNKEEKYRFSDEEIKDLVISMIYNNKSLSEVFATVAQVYSSGNKEVYDDIMAKNPIPEDFEDRLSDVKSKADDYLSIISEMPDVFTYTTEEGVNKVQSIKNKYPEYADDIHIIEQMYITMLSQGPY